MLYCFETSKKFFTVTDVSFQHPSHPTMLIYLLCLKFAQVEKMGLAWNVALLAFLDGMDTAQI